MNIFFAFLVACMVCSPLQAQQLSLSMHDLNHEPENGGAGGVELNGKLYFSANDGFRGEELWVYDGINSPYLVADIYEGLERSRPLYLTVFNGKLYFNANDGVAGTELWSYDEINGASMVADIEVGATGANPNGLIVFNNKLYFFKYTAGSNTTIWAYDGINPPSIAITMNLESNFGTELGVFDSKLYYGDLDGIGGGMELWSYDGINPPTMVADINPNLSYRAPRFFQVFNNKLYYRFDDGTSGEELWEYDGTNFPSMVYDINPGINSSTPSVSTSKHFAVLNNKLYFPANDGMNGTELWEYDGTNPPSLVQDIHLGGEGSNPLSLSVFQNNLYFNANDGITGEEMWMYDGINPPNLVLDIYTGPESSSVGGFVPFNNKLHFGANNGLTGVEMWVYDGLVAPELFFDINKFNKSSNPSSFAELNGDLYFLAWVEAFKAAVFQYDGAGAPMLVDTIPIPSSELKAFNNKLFFTTREGEFYEELWASDGVNPPSREFVIREDFDFNYNGNELFVFNDELYFPGYDSLSGYELWKYDGNNPPSILVDIRSGVESSYPNSYTVFNNDLYFVCNDSTNGSEIWKYDGVNAPNILVDLNPGTENAYPSNLFIFMGKLYFIANDGNVNRGLWAYDGVNSPTLAVDLAGLTGYTIFSNFVVYDDQVYFKIYNAGSTGNGQELWNYDGINPPTQIMVLSEEFNSFFDLATHNDLLYFGASDNSNGQELWSYDGINPPALVKDIYQGTYSSIPSTFYTYNDKLLFTATDGFHGHELWELTTCMDINTCCTASFYHYPDTSAQYTLTVVNTSSGDSLSYLWDFGDGTISTDALPSHTYAAADSYELCLTITNSSGNCSDTFCSNISVLYKTINPLSINVISSNDNTAIPDVELLEMNIFPNPTSEIIYFLPSMEEEFTVNIYDLMGKLLLTKSNSTAVNLESLASGMYLFEVKWKNKRLTKKIIKN